VLRVDIGGTTPGAAGEPVYCCADCAEMKPGLVYRLRAGLPTTPPAPVVPIVVGRWRRA
jgi:hypothetical protein